MNEEEARAVLEQTRMERREACRQEIAAILERYQCRLIATPQITEDGRIVAPVAIIVAEP